MQRAANGSLLELTQAGWKITFTPPAQQNAGRMPQRLQLTNGSQQIRLVIDEWRPVTPTP
jgi:outer membrane biogenesis lipoprotein LolB